MFNEDNNSRCSYFVEEERELLIPRVSVLLEHAPAQLGPLVHHHLAHGAEGRGAVGAEEA